MSTGQLLFAVSYRSGRLPSSHYRSSDRASIPYHRYWEPVRPGDEGAMIRGMEVRSHDHR